MINDIVSFQIHLHALEKMLQATIHKDKEENEIVHFVQGRVLA